MSRYEVIIIGGGPAGSTAATLLARAGRRVLVLEKETFPRFHIGESLLPYNRPIFEELGLLPAIEQAGFLKKIGAQFWLGNGLKHVDFLFSNGSFNTESQAWQVERSIFDDMLLKHAAAQGAEVRQGCAVESHEVGDDAVRVRTPAGEFDGAFLLDASGVVNFTGMREGLRELHPRHQKVAIFGHFHGIPMTPGNRAGDIIIVRLENEWAWLIPLTAEKVSVGLVVDKARLKDSGLTPQEMFDHLVASSAYMREKMAPAERAGPLRTIADYTYKNRRFVSPRLVRAGDAAGFMDPIFSSGVHLAMQSAREAAHAINEALDRGAAMTRGLRRYEKWLRRSMSIYWGMIEGFYTRPFIEVFIEPRPFLRLPCAISSVLAGCLEYPWKVRWRMRVFHWLVKLQALRAPAVPERFS